MDNWISVDEELPEHMGTVLVTDGEVVALGSMNKVTGLGICHTGYQEMFGFAFTHWQPLPPPPAK